MQRYSYTIVVALQHDSWRSAVPPGLAARAGSHGCLTLSPAFNAPGSARVPADPAGYYGYSVMLGVLWGYCGVPAFDASIRNVIEPNMSLLSVFEATKARSADFFGATLSSTSR